MYNIFFFFVTFFPLSSMAMDLASDLIVQKEPSCKEIEEQLKVYIPFKKRELIGFKGDSEKKEYFDFLKTQNKDVVQYILNLHFKMHTYDKCQESFFKIQDILKKKDYRRLFDGSELSCLDILRMPVQKQDALIRFFDKSLVKSLIDGHYQARIVPEGDEEIIINFFPEEKRKGLQLKVVKGFCASKCVRSSPLMMAVAGLGLWAGFSIAAIATSNSVLVAGSVTGSIGAMGLAVMMRWIHVTTMEELAETVSYGDNNN